MTKKTSTKPAETSTEAATKTFYVHVRTGNPEEVIRETKTPKKGWEVVFSGTEEQCAKYVTR